MNDTKIKESYAVLTRSGSVVGGYGTLSRARKAQKSWLEEGHPAQSGSKYGWIHHGISNGGLIEELTDTLIVKRTEIVIDQVVQGSQKKRKEK